MDRKEKIRSLNKEDIIIAAEKLFFENNKGIYGATMDEIAKASNFTKRTIYTYYSSKEQIYFEIMIRGYRLMLDHLKKSIDQSSDGYKELKSVANAFYTFSQNYHHYFWAIIDYENNDLDFKVDDELIHTCYQLGQEVMKIMNGAVKKGISDGSFRDDIDVEKTTLIIWAFTLGAFGTIRKKKNYIENYYHMTHDEFISLSFDHIFRMLKN